MNNPRKKILYVAPHLSTGGQPQYLLKQIEHFYKDYQIKVVEVRNSGGDAFVVQKNKIKALVPVHTLYEDKSDILKVIDDFEPDIIHFQEIPQHDLDYDILDKIWDDNRKYFIIATTHGSFTDPDTIIYQPDRYILVSEWSRKKFEHLGIDTMLWEYPIEDIKYDKDKAKEVLGFEKDWKHVLNVGLFAPGKNQAEIFEVARLLEKYKIKFHFVGNQAGNFEDYWKPLMDDKPSNCVVWGERNDADKFYAAADFFYFSTLWELNPLSIKEALSYKLPCIFRRLHTYLDTYDNNPLVTYIDGDVPETKKIILEQLKPEFGEISGWFAYKDMYKDIVQAGYDGCEFVEIGAWMGKSTNYMVQKIKESGKRIHFTTIDTFKGTPSEEWHNPVVQSYNGDLFPEFIDNTLLSNNYGLYDIIKDDSLNAVHQFKNNSIDYIMIDGGHSYTEVTNDLKSWYKKVKPGGIISGDDYTISTETTKAVDDFFYGQFDKTYYRAFLRKKPKIQIKHLLTSPFNAREYISIASIKQLQKYGIDYTQSVTEVYKDIPPTEHCRRPEHISKDNKPGELWPGAGLGWITGGHYGCYLAHKNAVDSLDNKYDYTLIFEADAFIYTGLEEFVDIVHKACFISERDDVYYIGLANNPSRSKERVDELFSKTAHNQDLAHAYLVRNKDKQWWKDRIADCEWDVGDLWYNHIFHKYPVKRYTTNKMYSNQTEGFSLLDQTIKTWNV
jgi:hypothetical protein